jgi:formyltetrahydrofolate-dependent phosphoribosylglycinamide formyltransferase
MSAPNQPISLAVLISGGGTTLRNLIDKIAAGKLAAEIRLVISSNPTAKGLQFAQAAGIRTLVVERKQHATPESFRDAIFNPTRDCGAQLVVMGGFLKHVLIPSDFAGRVINIHPSLIPAFCGQGMFGHHVHEAVLAAGARQSGCTVHYVDDQYDHGPIILQRTVPVLDDDTPDTLAARVFAAECEALPEAIGRLARGLGA